MLKKHLDALNKQIYKDFDVIVIDSGASQDYKIIKSMGKRYKYRLIVKHFKKDLGGAGSCYEGCKIAYSKGYKYIMLTDYDAIPVSRNMTKVLINNASKGMACLPANTTEYHTKGKAFTMIDAASHNYFTFPCEVIKKVGLPNKELFIYYDDLDYTARIAKYYSLAKINNIFYSHRSGLSLSLEAYLKPKFAYYASRNSIITNKSIMGKLRSAAFTLATYSIISLSVLPSGYQFEYAPLVFRALFDGLFDISGRRELPAPTFKMELVDSRLPANSIYITPHGIEPEKNLARILPVINEDELSIKRLLQLYLANDNLLVDNYVWKSASGRLLPFINKGLYILVRNGKNYKIKKVMLVKT